MMETTINTKNILSERLRRELIKMEEILRHSRLQNDVASQERLLSELARLNAHLYLKEASMQTEVRNKALERLFLKIIMLVTDIGIYGFTGFGTLYVAGMFYYFLQPELLNGAKAPMMALLVRSTTFGCLGMMGGAAVRILIEFTRVVKRYISV